MDIQFAYNLERMLYFVCDDNPDIVRPIMTEVEKQFRYEPGAKGCQLDPKIVTRIQETFLSISVSDANTLNTIQEMKEKHNILLCPHSAISVFAGRTQFNYLAHEAPTLCVLTAHPSKFESAVLKATGSSPPLPASVIALKSLPQRFETLEKKQGATDEEWRKDWIEKIKYAVIVAAGGVNELML